MSPQSVLDALRQWLIATGRPPQDFQERTWQAFARGDSGLVHVPTGAGKTYAAYLAALAEVAAAADHGVQVLFVTPMRATANDVAKALREPCRALGLAVAVGVRTGDTKASERARQRRRPPQVLVTTPESLCLLLCRQDAAAALSRLRAVVVDEWHQLLPSKRGSQVELCLARLRRFAGAALRTWGLSATLGDVHGAAQALVGGVVGQP